MFYNKSKNFPYLPYPESLSGLLPPKPSSGEVNLSFLGDLTPLTSGKEKTNKTNELEKHNNNQIPVNKTEDNEKDELKKQKKLPGNNEKTEEKFDHVENLIKKIDLLKKNINNQKENKKTLEEGANGGTFETLGKLATYINNFLDSSRPNELCKKISKKLNNRSINFTIDKISKASEYTDIIELLLLWSNCEGKEDKNKLLFYFVQYQMKDRDKDVDVNDTTINKALEKLYKEKKSC